MMDCQYLNEHMRDLDGLLGHDDARAIPKGTQTTWLVNRSSDPGETPVALAIATKTRNRARLGFDKRVPKAGTTMVLGVSRQEQRAPWNWCLQEAIIWLVVGGHGFKNRRAMTVCSKTSFQETSLDRDKTIVMSSFIGQDLGRRARKYIRCHK